MLTKQYRVSEVARMCGVTIRAVHRWIATGRLPATRAPHAYWRIRHDDLVGFAAAQGITLCELDHQDQRPASRRRLTRDVYTVGEVARMCRVSHRTVAKWCDAGLLGHYRLPAHKRDRRIPHEALVRFLRQYGLDEVVADNSRDLVVVSDNPDLHRCIHEWFDNNAQIHIAASAIRAGMLLARVWPHAVVVDASVLGRYDTLQVIGVIRGEVRPRQPAIAVIVGEDQAHETWPDGVRVLMLPADREALRGWLWSCLIG